MVDRLLELGWDVSVIDNFSSGKPERLNKHLNDPRFRLIRGDINDREALLGAMDGCTHVFHLAADPVIRGGFDDEAKRRSPTRNNVSGTQEVLEAMVRSGAERILFASSSTVYGEAKTVPTPEDYGPLKPISIYGASKLACEGFVTAYSHGFGLSYWIFRFANIVGSRAVHGVVPDFISKLRDNPGELEILGDGRQQKCYMHVEDCLDAMLFCMKHSKNEIFNLGTDTPISVVRVAHIVIEEMDLSDVEFRFTGGRRGWKGDLPLTYLDICKLKALGYSPAMDSEEAVRRAASEILAQGSW